MIKTTTSTPKELLIQSPFELPDVHLAIETIRAGAFPILHLGRDRAKAERSLEELSSKMPQPFGVCMIPDEMADLRLPEQVSKIVLPFGAKVQAPARAELLYQVYSVQQARQAIKENVPAIVLKGAEGAGRVAAESSFVMFQGVVEACRKAGVKVYIQGGVGVHNSAAFMALGAAGVILDDQVAAFPECSAPKELKALCMKLSGTEIGEIDGFRVLVRKNSPALPGNASFSLLRPLLGGYDLSTHYLPMGQDIALATDLYNGYKKLKDFVYAFHEALHGHIRQAKRLDIIGEGAPLARELGVKYPIVQGPMARVSDVPEFIRAVADAGAFPFLALSVMEGEALRETVAKTAKLMGNRSWGISLLGFATPETYKEQAALIVETKPRAVLISGGHGIMAAQFEKAGIKTFVHAPSVALLEQYIKDGNTHLIFEGRESGGHIGPFWSTLLWEKQINRLVREDDLSRFDLLFAGGIHDDFSSTFISVMTASLAALGAKIGVQMGTSYLYTKEIVETGAITPLYQKLSVENTATLSLESVPGQANRMLPSPFVDYFNREKERILSSGETDSLKVRYDLENLNVGRLRIAAKGLDMLPNGTLTKQTAEQQHEKGMYLIGDVSVFINKTTTLKKLHAAVAVNNKKLLATLPDYRIPAFLSDPVDVAVIGMECLFPQAADLEEFWKNIVTGKDCIEEVPDIRWNKDIFYKPGSHDSDYLSCKTGGFVPTVDFDPMEFGLTPQSLTSIEPLQLLSLMVAKRALEKAGYADMSPHESENTAVIFGGEGLADLSARIGFRSSYRQYVGELPEELKKRLPALTPDTFTGMLSNITTGRISNRLNLKGRNYNITAACASGLTALNLACDELTNRHSDTVVFGAFDFHSMLNDYMLFSSTFALSPTGYCASFDAGADGITLGEGVGVVILKRLEDAERDGDNILAVIKGIGGSSDGKGMGLTAPNKEGQMLAMRRAYRQAGISPDEVGLVEAHGTGTAVGDKVEMLSTSAVFLAGGATPGQTVLGTVKSQIGHTKCAAGAAGLIRAVLSVRHGVIPPTIHLAKPMDSYDGESSPFVFNTRAGVWNSPRRIAAVSAFGFGGANAHVIVENYSPEIPGENTMKEQSVELFVFRGDTLREAQDRAEAVSKLLSSNGEIPLRDVAYSLAVENDKPVQIIALASSLDELTVRIVEIHLGKKSRDLIFRDQREGKVAFLFSGQGSQRVDMARDLMVAFPGMRRILARHPEYEKILFPPTLFGEAEKKELNRTITDTRNAQPLLGIVDLAIAEHLHYLGIEPDMLAGHSYGELPALCFAGAFDSSKLVELSRRRAESILQSVHGDAGKMMAVGIPATQLSELLKDETEVWAVNLNSPKQTVLAATSAAMAAFQRKLDKKGIGYKEINVACAFHSPLLAQSQSLYADVLKDVPFGRLHMDVWSNTTALRYPVEGEAVKERLAEHLVKPVRFSDQIEAMYEAGARIFIETGPGNVLLGLVQAILGKDGITTIQTEAKDRDGVSFLMDGLAHYLATGKMFDMKKLYEGRGARFIEIDKPERYAKSKLVWRINGQYAHPKDGRMPESGMPFSEPLGLKPVSKAELAAMTNAASGYTPDTSLSSEGVMMEYLDSMRLMIENQRDVMLTYFGQDPRAVRPRPTGSPAVSVPVNEVRAVEAASSSASFAAHAPIETTTAVQVFDSGQVKTALLEVVSGRTGYPVDMLGLDLDLEGELSIDSIKRMEIVGDLKEKLNLGDVMEASEEVFIKMASLKTLNELIAWIDELKEQAPAPVMAAVTPARTAVSEQATAPAERAAAQSFTTEHIRNTLLEVVSGRTGYPVDMLGLDLDLEGELSIDSIKRMEIVGDLKEKLNLGDAMEASEEVFIKMASLKTLNEIVAWIDEMNSSGGEVAPSSANNGTKLSGKISEEPSGTEPSPAKQAPLARVLFEIRPFPLPSEKVSVAGRRFAITDDGGAFAPKIKQALEAAGARADIVSRESVIDDFDGLVLVNAFASPNAYTIGDLFGWIHDRVPKRVRCVFTFSDITALIEQSKDPGHIKSIQGFSGFLKSLAHEYPGVKFRSVVSNVPFEPESLASIVTDELTADDLSPEVLYDQTGRCRYEIIFDDPVVDAETTDKRLDLDNEATVLVLGGAQGIAPELVARLAAEYPCRYILVGRSTILDDDGGVYAALETKADIRNHLLTVEGMRSPAEIEKKIEKIFKSNQIAMAVRKIEAASAKAIYRSTDITDTEGFRAFLRSVRREYGRLDGIIHSAGLLNDKLFADKTRESFEKVYRTKVDPLHVIIDEMDDDLKLLVLFSSIASSYGSRGQSDYAAANSVLDFAAVLDRLRPQMRTVVFNWGPWKGAGMVSDSLEAEFLRRGVSMIPLGEGAAKFVQELKYGNASRAIIMGGGEKVEQFLKTAGADGR